MANISEQDDQMDLPPGFRFHPTDEELISHYLFKKVLDSSFCARAMGEADLNKSEPWELPWKAKMGEKEWYFFCLRDKKYPTGLRTNRATDSGYWKATGKDREIYKEKSLVGMKKTLVFYKGRAPKGVKSNWVMHEYRLEGIYSIQNLPITAKKEWVICRVFQKNSGGKKTHISGLVKMGSFVNELGPSALPPLMESSPVAESACVPCFSNLIDHFNNPLLPVSSSSMFPRTNSFCSAQSQSVPLTSNVEFSSSVVMQDQSILALMMQQQERDEDAAAAASTSAGAMDLDCFWHY